MVAVFNDVTDTNRGRTAANLLLNHYRLLAENATDLVWQLDTAGVIRWTSRSTESGLGWTPEQLLGTVAADLVHPDEQAELRAWRGQILAGKPMPPLEMRMRCADGNYRWMSCRTRRTLDAVGSVDGRIVGLRDVHELVSARELLSREQSRLRATVDSLLDPHVLLEAVRDEFGQIVDFVYTDANAAACKYNGLAYQELVGARLLDLLPGHDDSGLFQTYRHVVQSGEPLVLDDFTYAQELLGGVPRNYDIRAVRVGDGLSSTWRDVTRRHEAAAALAEAEDQYRLLAENASDIVWRIDADSVIRWVSPSVHYVLGWPPEHLLGALPRDLTHPDDLPALAEHWDAAAAGEPIPSFETRVRTADGGYRWMSIRVRAAFAGDGSFSGATVGFRDIDEEVLVRQALSEQSAALRLSEKQFRLMAENTTDVVMLSDPEWKLTWISPATERVLGYSPTDLVGLDNSELIHPDDLPTLASLRNTSGGLRSGIHFELRVRDATGDYRWMSGVSTEFMDEDGQPNGRISTLRDIHEQVLAQQGLERSELRYRMLAENASDVVAELTVDAVLLWVSPSVQTVLGWRPERVIGMNITELVHPDDRESDTQWRKSMPVANASPNEIRALTADGRYRWVSVSIRPRTAADGSAVGWVSSLRDVHEQVLARQALANSQRRYRMLAENASDVVWQLNADTLLEWVTPSIEAVLGWHPDQLLGHPAIDVVHPEDREALTRWRTEVFAGAQVAPFELRLRKADGEFLWMSLHTRPTTDADGSVNGAVVGLRDVHEQVVAREQLARSERMFRLAMDGAPHGMAIVGLHGRLVRVNDALCDLVGHDAAWMHDHTEFDVLHPDGREEDMAARGRLLAGGAEYDVHEGRLRTASGDVLWVQHSLALIRDEHEMPLFYVSQYQDITAARASKLQLQYRAEHDVLTGLINRGELQERIVEVLARRTRPAGVPGLLFCDLDFFKKINDAHGHASGDYMLRVTAERIASALRDDDEVARLGGDEFVVVLPEVTDVSAAILVAEKVRAAVALPFPLGKDQVTITLSVGIALATPGIEARRLLRNADSALYEAKNSGRDRISVFEGGQ